MITIKDIASELEEILNGTSGNIPSGAERPFEGLFAVRTEGYHLDNVTDYQEGKNFFPVFLGEPTGEFNPISGLEQMDMEIPVSIYFPIRFKSRMLEMQKYLSDVFIGRAIGFNQGDDGKYGQYGVCNISIAELGEITDMDVDQFGNSILKGLNEFIEEQYKMPVHNSEPWICLNFSIYLATMKNAMSTAEGSPIYGNAYSVWVQYQDWSEEMATDGITIAFGAQTESQQGFSLTGTADGESTSYATTNATSYVFEATIKRTAFWYQVMTALEKGALKPNDFELKIQLKDEYKSGEETDYADYGMEMRCMVCTSINVPIGINKPLTMQFTFTPMAEAQ